MKYKGFTIEPEYHAGSNFTINEDTGVVKDRKPTSKDIAFYVIYDEGKRWIAEDTIAECKETIDSFLNKHGLATNPA